LAADSFPAPRRGDVPQRWPHTRAPPPCAYIHADPGAPVISVAHDDWERPVIGDILVLGSIGLLLLIALGAAMVAFLALLASTFKRLFGGKATAPNEPASLQATRVWS
jgi:hypothetical protein